MEASKRHFFYSQSPFISFSFSFSIPQSVKGSARGRKSLERGGRGAKRAAGGGGGGVRRVLLCQHCGIFPKMHIASIQIGDVFIGVHRKLHERRVFGRPFWPRPPRLHGWSSWLVKLLFFRCALAGKHISSQATTQFSPSQYGCHAEEPIEGKYPAPYILTAANIPRPLCHCVPRSCG